MPERKDTTLTAPKTSPPAQPAAAANAVELDDSGVNANYANFCRISGTPEEVLIDFATTMPSQAEAGKALVLGQRVITNWYTAKRLLHALHLTVQRHEAIFGELELNAEQRVNR